MTEENRERTREMINLMQAFLDGEVVELYFNGTWTKVNSTHWWASGFNYRIADATTPDTINWDHVAPEFKWMARDENGFSYLYSNKPKIIMNTWEWIEGTKMAKPELFSSYRKGTINWKESLVIRPVCEQDKLIRTAALKAEARKAMLSLVRPLGHVLVESRSSALPVLNVIRRKATTRGFQHGSQTIGTSGLALTPDEAKAETLMCRVESPQQGNNWRPRRATNRDQLSLV